LTLFEKNDVCEILDVLRKDHHFDRKDHLIGKKVRIICMVSIPPLDEESLFNGWVEFPDGVPQIKIEKGEFVSFTHVKLKKIGSIKPE